jgi:hypothetical protein
MKDARAISQLFERYHRERVVFASSIADLARHEPNCQLLEDGKAPDLLQNLLNDPAPGGLRASATLGLGRLVAQSSVTANKLVANGTVNALVKLLNTPFGDEPSDRREALQQRRAAAFALRAIVKHGISAAKGVVAADAVDAAINCLQLPEGDVREGAAWLLDTLAALSKEMAMSVACMKVPNPDQEAYRDCSRKNKGLILEGGQGGRTDGGAMPYLVACLECSEIGVKRAAAACLGSMAQHSAELASAVATSGAPKAFANVLAQGETIDIRLARNLLCSLSQIAQGGRDCAHLLVNAGLLPVLARSFSINDEIAQRFAACTVRDIACQDASMAEAVVNTPRCLGNLVNYTNAAQGLNALPGVMALGHMCSLSEALAEAVIVSGGLTAITVALAHNLDETVKAAAAWAIGQAGKHRSEHAQAVAESGALLALMQLESKPTSSPDLMKKCGTAACAIVAELASLGPLDALLRM